MTRSISVSTFAACLVVAVYWSAPARAAEGQVSLTVCNKGTVPVLAVVGDEQDDPLFGYRFDVTTQPIAPRVCAEVVTIGGREPGSKSSPMFLGFALAAGDSLRSARVSEVPDFGVWENNFVQAALEQRGSGPVLSRSNRTLCARNARLSYRLTTKSEPNCATLQVSGVSGGLVPVVAALRFQPMTSQVVLGVGGSYQTEGGDYYLDVAPKANDLDLHASLGAESSGPARTPEENIRDVAATLKIMSDIANSVPKSPPPPPPRRDEPMEFTQQRAQWWKQPTQPASSYQASWMGRVVTVRATVASIGDGAMNAMIVLKEIPRDTLTVCPQFSNPLRSIVGQDLNALNGRTIEVTGLVDHFDGCGAGATIRIFELEQFRLIGAR